MAEGNVLVIIASGFVVPVIASETAMDLVCTGLDASFTEAVNLKVPLAAAFPSTRPLALRIRPVGRVPEATDHLYGFVPPVAIID